MGKWHMLIDQVNKLGSIVLGIATGALPKIHQYVLNVVEIQTH